MKLKELLNADLILLDEGLVLFKESDKITRTIQDLEKKLSNLYGKPSYNEVKELVAKLKKAQLEFLKVEHSAKEKKISRENLKSLKEKNKELLKIVNTHEIKRNLKRLGLYALFFGAVRLLAAGTETIIHAHQGGEDTGVKVDDNIDVPADLPEGFSMSDMPTENGPDAVDKYIPKDSQANAYHPKSQDNPLAHKAIDYRASNIPYNYNNVPGQIAPGINHEIDPKKIVADICSKENVPYNVINGIITKESNWKPSAVGVNAQSKDIGLMQLNSRYVDWFVEKFWTSKEKFNATDVEDNVTLGVRYYKWLLKLFKGDMTKALTAYNAGPTAVLNGEAPSSSKKYAASILAFIETEKAKTA